MSEDIGTTVDFLLGDMYAGNRSPQTVVTMLQSFSTLKSTKEYEVYKEAVFCAVSELRFIEDHPEELLRKTAELVGGLLYHDLIRPVKKKIDVKCKDTAILSIIKRLGGMDEDENNLISKTSISTQSPNEEAIYVDCCVYALSVDLFYLFRPQNKIKGAIDSPQELVSMGMDTCKHNTMSDFAEHLLDVFSDTMVRYPLFCTILIELASGHIVDQQLSSSSRGDPIHRSEAREKMIKFHLGYKSHAQHLLKQLLPLGLSQNVCHVSLTLQELHEMTSQCTPMRKRFPLSRGKYIIAGEGVTTKWATQKTSSIEPTMHLAELSDISSAHKYSREINSQVPGTENQEKRTVSRVEPTGKPINIVESVLRQIEKRLGVAEPNSRCMPQFQKILNTLTEEHLDTVVEHANSFIEKSEIPWMCVYLLRRTILKDPKGNALVYDMSSAISEGFLESLTSLTFMLCEELLDSCRTAAVDLERLVSSSHNSIGHDSEDIQAPSSHVTSSRSSLRNIGAWFSQICSQRTDFKPLEQLHLPNRILDAFEGGYLSLLIPFTCKALCSLDKCPGIKSSPWNNHFISLLDEIRRLPGIKNIIAFEIELLFKSLGIKYAELSDIGSTSRRYVNRRNHRNENGQVCRVLRGRIRETISYDFSSWEENFENYTNESLENNKPCSDDNNDPDTLRRILPETHDLLRMLLGQSTTPNHSQGSHKNLPSTEPICTDDIRQPNPNQTRTVLSGRHSIDSAVQPRTENTMTPKDFGSTRQTFDKRPSLDTPDLKLFDHINDHAGGTSTRNFSSQNVNKEFGHSSETENYPFFKNHPHPYAQISDSDNIKGQNVLNTRRDKVIESNHYKQNINSVNGDHENVRDDYRVEFATVFQENQKSMINGRHVPSNEAYLNDRIGSISLSKALPETSTVMNSTAQIGYHNDYNNKYHPRNNVHTEMPPRVLHPTHPYLEDQFDTRHKNTRHNLDFDYTAELMKYNENKHSNEKNMLPDNFESDDPQMVFLRECATSYIVNVVLQIVPQSVDSAIEEIMAIGLERATSIATTSSFALVTKDFPGCPHTDLLSKTTENLASYLACSLILVTCKSLLKNAMLSQMRKNVPPDLMNKIERYISTEIITILPKYNGFSATAVVTTTLIVQIMESVLHVAADANLEMACKLTERRVHEVTIHLTRTEIENTALTNNTEEHIKHNKGDLVDNIDNRPWHDQNPEMEVKNIIDYQLSGKGLEVEVASFIEEYPHTGLHRTGIQQKGDECIHPGANSLPGGNLELSRDMKSNDQISKRVPEKSTHLSSGDPFIVSGETTKDHIPSVLLQQMRACDAEIHGQYDFLYRQVIN